MQKVGQIAAGFLAANVVSGAFSKITGFFGNSIKNASDLGESMNAVNVVFGNSAGKILDWGKTASTQAGLSQRAFNQMATPLGAMLKNAGFNMDQVADKTIDLTKRAADMASVFNTDVEDALVAIQAALRGETDPIEKYGVSMNAAKIEAEAMAMSGKKVAADLTDQEKAAARLSLIMKQTAAVQNDFTNTSDQLANKTRIQKARMEELQATIGQKLIPVSLKITEIKLKLAEAIGGKLLPTIFNLIDRIGFLVGVFRAAFNDPDITSDGIVGVVEGIAVAIRELYDKGKELLDKLAEAFGQLKEKLQPVLEPLAKFLEKLASNQQVINAVAVGIGVVLVAAFGALAISAGAAAVSMIAATAPIIGIGLAIAGVSAAVYLLIKNWDDIKAKTIEVFNSLPGPVQAAMTFIRDHIQTQIQGIIAAFNAVVANIKNVVQLVTAILHGDWARAWSELKQIAETQLDLMLALVKVQFGAIPKLMVQLGKDLYDAARKAFQRLIDAVEDLGDQLYRKGSQIAISLVDGFADGILAGKDWLINKVKGVFNDVVNAAKGVLDVFSPSGVFRDIGEDVVEGFGQGLEGMSTVSAAVMAGLQALADSVGLTVAQILAMISTIPTSITPPSVSIPPQAAGGWVQQPNGSWTFSGPGAGGTSEPGSPNGPPPTGSVNDFEEWLNAGAPGASSPPGGTSGGFSFPAFQHGTPFVPRNMLAFLHKGERVTPAGQNGGGLTINVYAGSVIEGERTIERVIRDAIRRGGFRDVWAT